MGWTSKKGRAQDYKSQRLCYKYGATGHTISAGSKGVFDITCWGYNGSVYIQNKSNRMPGTEELIRLIQARVPAGSIKLIMVWIDGKRFPRTCKVSNTQVEEINKATVIGLLKRTLGCRTATPKLRNYKRPATRPGTKAKVPSASRAKR